MSLILTLGAVLGLSITSVSIGIAAQKSTEDPAAAKNQKNIDICTQNLLAIGKAVQAYHNENGDYPEWLSVLHPKYLPDANFLLCPADELGGKPLFSSNADPKMPVSYGYQFHPEYRAEKIEQRKMYGDAMPLVRCRHHANQPFDCLNLSFSFKVYPSSHVWESAPEEMYGTPQKAIVALEKGLQRQPDNESFFDVYLTLARLYIKAGREEGIESLINRFKSVIKPDNIKAHFYLAELLEMMKRDEEVFETFKKLEAQAPNDRGVLRKLAHLHQELGEVELAIDYQRKAEPSPELIGKPVPDFFAANAPRSDVDSATDLDGNPISLQQYRGKVVLLDFWAVWCGFCIVEMPNLKNVYDTYKDQGFDIIGVSLDDEEAELRNYLKENDIPWRQIFSGQGFESPLVQQYGIDGIPAPWLIARDGTLISTDARGVLLEYLVVEALQDKSENE